MCAHIQLTVKQLPHCPLSFEICRYLLSLSFIRTCNVIKVFFRQPTKDPVENSWFPVVDL